MDNIITFSRVAKRLNLEVDTLIDFLSVDLKQSIIQHGINNRLKGKLMNLLKDALLSNFTLKAKIESDAQLYRETVIGYFEQEGVLREGRIGFVEIRWRGTLQDAIYKILKS